jgi:hypothetical protein
LVTKYHFCLFLFTATSPNSNKVASCSFSIHVRDIIPPRVYNCPNDFDIYLDKGKQKYKKLESIFYGGKTRAKNLSVSTKTL